MFFCHMPTCKLPRAQVIAITCAYVTDMCVRETQHVRTCLLLHTHVQTTMCARENLHMGR